MCGIIGYIGTKKASPILIAGLLRLEYRGYDSAGISTVEKNHLSVMKDKGRVKNLYTLDGIDKLEGMGCNIEIEKNKIQIKVPKKIKAVDIKTMPYPGFPTDMQSIFVSLLTTVKGTSVVVENIFENRYRYVQELVRMGAKITIEGKTAIIKGVKKLYGANVKATDLRGGAALVIAASVAKGTTKVDNIEYILRGYENFITKLQNLGLDIKIN